MSVPWPPLLYKFRSDTKAAFTTWALLSIRVYFMCFSRDWIYWSSMILVRTLRALALYMTISECEISFISMLITIKTSFSFTFSSWIRLEGKYTYLNEHVHQSSQVLVVGVVHLEEFSYIEESLRFVIVRESFTLRYKKWYRYLVKEEDNLVKEGDALWIVDSVFIEHSWLLGKCGFG